MCCYPTKTRLHSPLISSKQPRMADVASPDRVLSASAGPRMGDIRCMQRPQTLWLTADVRTRRDWGRYQDAIGAALARGIDIRWIGGTKL